MKSADAPVAVGRSGQRIETSQAMTDGLIGEKLSLSGDPSRNSFVQRSWMFRDDPALMHRIQKMPEPSKPDGTSLPIGESNGAIDTHWNHGRRAVLTGDVLTRTGASRAGIFMDDNDYTMHK